MKKLRLLNKAEQLKNSWEPSLGIVKLVSNFASKKFIPL